MKYMLKIIASISTLLVISNTCFTQINLTEKELIGNWKVLSGTGDEFDPVMMGEIFSFDNEHKIYRIEEGEKIESDWKLKNDIITVNSYYNDGINDPEIETLTIISFDGKKLTVKYRDSDDDTFTIILERTKAP